MRVNRNILVNASEQTSLIFRQSYPHYVSVSTTLESEDPVSGEAVFQAELKNLGVGPATGSYLSSIVDISVKNANEDCFDTSTNLGPSYSIALHSGCRPNLTLVVEHHGLADCNGNSDVVCLLFRSGTLMPYFTLSISANVVYSRRDSGRKIPISWIMELLDHRRGLVLVI